MIARSCLCLPLAALLCSPLAAKSVERAVVVTTNISEIGRHLSPPAPDSPLTYRVMTRGFAELGVPVAGESAPDRDAFLRLVLAELREEGFEPAAEGQTPAVALGITWGSLRGRRDAALTYLAGRNLPITWEPRVDSRYAGVGQGTEVNEGTTSVLAAINRDVRTKITGIADDDLYFLTISAYDWKSAFAGRQVLLWQTRIATSARKTSATAALALCLRAGAPLLGRPAEAPQWISATMPADEVSLPTAAGSEFDLASLVVHDFPAVRR